MWDKHVGNFPAEYLNIIDINWNIDIHSVIIEHRIEFSHNFDWEKNFRRRILEQKIDFRNRIHTHVKEWP